VAAREAIADTDARLFVSAITAFELGVKHRRGALKLPLPPLTWYERALDFS
jgi:PIN domain nuclease of toxin-antitoxin system